MRHYRIVWLLALLPGCSATHLVYVHQSIVGVELAASGTEGNNSLSIGYDSRTFAIVPRYSPPKGQGSTEVADGEAMSLVAANQTYIEGVSRIVIHHMLATGEPATKIAKESGAVAAVVAETLVDPTAEAAKARLDGGNKK